MKTAIVLGYGVFQETNTEYKEYLEWIAKDCQEQGIEKIIFTGGCSNNTLPGISEAKANLDYLQKIYPNMPQSVLEEKSITTAQNLQFSAQFIDPNLDVIIVYCDLYRTAKINWISLHYLLGLSRHDIAILLLEFVKVRKIRHFTYKNLTVKGYDFPSRDKMIAFGQTYSSLIEVESLYDQDVDQKLNDQRKQEFGI
mgnify:CR=1 FL=1